MCLAPTRVSEEVYQRQKCCGVGFVYVSVTLMKASVSPRINFHKRNINFPENASFP